MDKKRAGIIAVTLSILILVTTALLANNVRSESNIIGGNDGPTDIWVTTETD